MRVILIALLLVGCKGVESSSKAANNGPAQVYLFGDDNSMGDDSFSKEYGVVNKSRKFDGSNGAMAFSQCHVVSFTDFKEGDVLIFSAGYWDAAWYGNQDPYDQVLKICTTAFAHAKSQGAKVIIVTPIRGPASLYAINLAPGSHIPSNNPAASDFFANILISIAKDLSLEYVDMNKKFTPNESLFTNKVLNKSGHEALKALINSDTVISTIRNK